VDTTDFYVFRNVQGPSGMHKAFYAMGNPNIS